MTQNGLQVLTHTRLKSTPAAAISYLILVGRPACYDRRKPSSSDLLLLLDNQALAKIPCSDLMCPRARRG